MQSYRQRGAVSRISIVVTVLLLVAALLGAVAYRQAKTDDNDSEPQATLDNAQCDFVNDENLCKFFNSWGDTEQYTLNATKEGADTTTIYTFRSEPDAFQLETTDDKTVETVAVGDTVYINDGDTWYEQTVESGDLNDYKQDNFFDISEPSSQKEADAITYSPSGTESCGELTCLTYKVDGLTDRGQTRIWFDDQEYKLRRITVTDDSNYSYDASVSYTEVEIEAPAQTTVLAEDERIPPGQSSPQEEELPATGDQFDPEEYRQWLEQRKASQ